MRTVANHVANELRTFKNDSRMWAIAQHDAALSNTGGALCSMPQSLAEIHYQSAVQ